MDETAHARTYGEGQGAARGALLRLEPGRVSEAASRSWASGPVENQALNDYV